MTDWYDAESLMAHWDINATKLLEIIKNGLQPFDVLGRPVLSPQISRKIDKRKEVKDRIKAAVEKYDELQSERYQNRLSKIKQDLSKSCDLNSREGFQIYHLRIKQIDDHYTKEVAETESSIHSLKIFLSQLAAEIDGIELGTAWQSVDHNVTPLDNQEMLDLVVECVFNIYDINRASAENNLPPIMDPSTKKKITPPSKEDPVFSFYKNGTIWKIGPIGAEANFHDLKGFHCIRFLLEKPNADFDPHVVMTQGKADPREISEKAIDVDLPKRSGAEAALPKVDARAKREILDKIDDLKQRMAVSEVMQKEEIQNEIECLEKYLKSSKGTTGTSTEQVRVNLQKNLKRALGKIEAAGKDMPALRPVLQHLSMNGPNQTIITGFKCRYSPNPSQAINWILTPPKQNK